MRSQAGIFDDERRKKRNHSSQDASTLRHQQQGSIDEFANSEMEKYDSSSPCREECIYSVSQMEEDSRKKKHQQQQSMEWNSFESKDELTSVGSNLRSRLKSISLRDPVSSSSQSPPLPLHPPSIYATSASKSSYKLAWINHHSQSVTEVKEQVVGQCSKKGLPALVPPRKKSFSAVLSSPFHGKNDFQLKNNSSSPIELPKKCHKNNNNININNNNNNNNTNHCNSNRITLPPLSTNVKVSGKSICYYFLFYYLLVVIIIVEYNLLFENLFFY